MSRLAETTPVRSIERTGARSSRLLAAEVIQVLAAYVRPEQAKIEKQLVLVAREMLKVDQQQGQKLLAVRYEHGRNQPSKIVVLQQCKSFSNVIPVDSKSSTCLHWARSLIDGKLI